MGLGKQIRLNRIFGHPSGRLCSVAVDHLVAYQQGLPEGLRNVPATIATLVKGKPDAITMYKGMAQNAWPPHAGSIPLIITSIAFTVDDTMMHQIARPHECVRLGADAISAAIALRSPREGDFLKMLAGIVEEAAEFDLPVVAHIYPRDFSGEPKVVHDPENILWAVRCGIELGADVIKADPCDDISEYHQVVNVTGGVPVLVRGGGRVADEVIVERTYALMQQGVRGIVYGRNVIQHPSPERVTRALMAIVHGGATPQQALQVLRGS